MASSNKSGVENDKNHGKICLFLLAKLPNMNESGKNKHDHWYTREVKFMIDI